LQTFAEYTTLCSGEEYTTISSTVPIIMELKYHLEEMTKKTGMASLSEKLRDELIKHFDKYINPSTMMFDDYYLTTFLDTKYTLVLNAEQIAKIKTSLIVVLKNGIAGATADRNSLSGHFQLENNSRDAADADASGNSGEVEPPLKKFQHLSNTISDKKREAEATDIASAVSAAEAEVVKFCELRHNIPVPCNKDAITFWLELESSFPNLSDFAEDLMMVPASSTPIEHTFSVVGYCCIGKRNRLTNQNLERDFNQDK